MASFPTPQQYTFNDFKGIRTRNGVAANGVISATVCKNIDFVPSSYDASINITTTLGNYTVGTYLGGTDLFAYSYEDKTIYIKDTEITAETVLYDKNGNVNTDDDWAVSVNDYYCFSAVTSVTSMKIRVYADGTGEVGSSITVLYSYPDRMKFTSGSGTYNYFMYGHNFQINFTTTTISIKDENNNTYTMARSSDDDYNGTNVILYDGHNAKPDPEKNIYDYTVIKGFETEQNGTKHLLLYVKNSSKGRLVEYNTSSNTFTTLIDDLTKTEEANGLTMVDSAYDVFVFTNGVEYYSVQLYPTTTIVQLNPQYDSNDVTGLALCEQDGSLVIGCNEGVVLASRKGDITDWDYVNPTDTNKPWYQIFGKKITAIVPYIEALLVFTDEDSTVLSGNMSDYTSGTRSDASLGGCMSFESWCKHDKYLFFYDDKQKNIYYYMQNDFGQKVLGEPLAPEVQVYFNNIEKLQMVSFVGDNRSEIWLLSDNFRLIFDYYVKEWTERVCQPLTSYFVYDNSVYSTSGAKVLKEKAGNICVFDDVYYPAQYTTQIINLGSFSNAKEMDIYPLLSVEQNYNNSFYFDCLVDGKKEKSKHVEMFFQGAIWADSTPQTGDTPDDELWDLQTFPSESSTVSPHIQQIKGKIIPFWYYLQFSFKTKVRGEDFSISCFELKGITQEYDTIGRK